MNESPLRDLESLDSKDVNEIHSVQPPREFNLHDPSLEFFGYVSHVEKVRVKDVAGIPGADVDGVGGNFNLETGMDTLADMLDSKKNSELEAVKLSNCITHENHPHIKLDFPKHSSSVKPETKDPSDCISSPLTSQIDHAPSESPSSTESVDINSEADDECMNESIPSSPASDIAENDLFYSSLNGCGSNHCTGNSDMDDTDMEVVLHPDYVIYQDNYHMGSKLTFSQHCIQINDSTACEKQGAFNIGWAVDDLIDIKSQLFHNSGMVLMKLCVISSNAGRSSHVSCTSGIEELKVAVVDSNWSLRHKQITSLNAKYLATWNTVLDMDEEGDLNLSHGPRCYFPNFQEPFDEVVYPKGDPDAVSLSKRDVDLLQPDTFINDTIIDFYIKYLKNKIPEEEKSRFHFFNSFFFRKLADMDKNPSSASDGKAAFLRVRKWTRKVNLFEKDYIFIPVNFNLHWSLIVICHPGEVVSFNDEEPDKSPRVPCILHMDSIKGYHSGLKNLVQSYLWEEWKDRKKDTCGEDLSSRFLNMRFLPVALPQQENSYDCGLFLLHYLELFLAGAPFNFNPFKLTKFSNFLNLDWFPPAEAYLKRTLIQRLIFELVENHGSHEGISSDNSDDYHYSENNDNRTGIHCHVINGGSSTSHSGQGIEITLLSASSSLYPQSFNTSGMVLKDLFEPGTTAGTLLGHCQSFDQQSSDHRLNGSIFSMEEDTDLSEQLVYVPTDPNFQQVAEISPQSCSLPCLPRGCGKEMSQRPKTSLQTEHDKAESSLETSSCASDDSDDIGVIENFPIREEARSSYEDGDEKICTPVENLEHLSDITGSAVINLPIDSLMDIAPHSNVMCAGNKNGENSSCQETLTIQLQQVSDTIDDKVTRDDVQMIDNMEPDICEEHAANINLPIDSLMDIASHSNVMCAGNKNGENSSCQETLTIQLQQVSDTIDDKVTRDDVQMIDNMEPDICEEHAANINLPIDSLMDIASHSNVMCAGNKNGENSSCQETLTIQLQQVSDTIDDKVTRDDVQMIDNMEPDICEEHAANINLPIDSLMDIASHSNVMCAGNKNGENSSCQETLTIQLQQVSDTIDDKVTRDDVQMIDNMKPDICEEQAAKRQRLTPLQGGSDGILTESNL